MSRIKFSLAAIALVAMSTAAQAQTPATKKLTLDLHAGMASASLGSGDSEIKTKSGANFGAGIGYDVTPAFRLGLGIDLAKLPLDEEGFDGDIGLTSFDLNGRYSFMNTARRWTPFLSAGVASRAIGADIDGVGDYEASGIGFNLGGGVDYAFSPKMALTTAAGYTMGKFGDQKLDGDKIEGDDLDGNGFKVNVGLTFRLF